MEIIAYANPKGGTGKTSLSLITARALTQIGKRVLFVDSDPQNSATHFLTDELHEKTLYNVYGNAPIVNNIVPVDWGFKLVPSEIRLMSLGNLSEQELKLHLETVADDYDYCIIDCLPYFNILMRNVIVAADTIVIPTTVDLFSFKSVHYMMDTMERMPMDAKSLVVVLTMWQPKQTHHDVFDNRLGDVFRTDERLKMFLADTHIYQSSPIKRIMAERDYKIKSPKALMTVTQHVAEITGCDEVLKLMEVG